MCWVPPWTVPYAILIFVFYLWYMGIYLSFTHEEMEVERTSSLFKVTLTGQY